MEFPAADGGLEARRRRWRLGCTVVLKPAEQTPLSALRLGELILEAGFRPAWSTSSPATARPRAPRWPRTPTSTRSPSPGSTEVGRQIVQAAAGNLKKVTLELGGKSPHDRLHGRRPGGAVPGAAMAIFFNHGQCCAAGSRLYVEADVFDDVIAGVAEQARKIKLGPGLDPDTQMGPLVSREQMNRVCGFVESGIAEGARAVAGGHRAGERGYFVEPTVLVDTTPEMKVVREEIFGPVVTAMPFTDHEHVLPAANLEQLRPRRRRMDTRHQPRRIESPPSCRPARSGSTATTFLTPPCPLAASRNRAGAARWAMTRSTTTWRPSRSASSSSNNGHPRGLARRKLRGGENVRD